MFDKKEYEAKGKKFGEVMRMGSLPLAWRGVAFIEGETE